MVSNLTAVLLLCAAALTAASSEGPVPFKIEDSSSQLNITFGELVVAVNKNPWRMRVIDRVSQKEILTETDSRHKLGFGRWEGDYLHIYEGYLFRVGLLVEWYHAQAVQRWSNDSSSVSVLVGTNDPSGRMLNVTLLQFASRQFSMRVTVEGKATNEANRVAVGLLMSEEEGFYGFGERFTATNQRGNRVGSWLEDGSWGLGVFDPATWKLRVPAGEESTYCPMPILFSTRGYALQIDTFYRSVFDLGKEEKGTMILEQESDSLDVIFYMSTTPRDAFSMTIDHNGHSLIPPSWEFSPWNQLGDEEQGVTQVQRIEEFFFKYDIPCSHAIDTVHFFPGGGEKGREQQLKEKNEQLLALGVKCTAYFNAMLEQSYTELYNYAAENSFFIKTKTGSPYNYSYVGASTFAVSQMDFTNRAAVSWYQQQLARSVDLSFHGWMYDYGEYTPPDSLASDGSSGLTMHNHFPLLYQKTAFDYLTSLDHTPTDAYAPDYVFYVRSSYAGSQKYTWAHWTGDPSSDWSYASGLPAQITASLNIGLSGMPYSGSDIGGFEWYVDPTPDLELWARWTAAGCVSGLMHEQGGGKGQGPKSHIFDFPNGTALWRRFAKLRMQLFPYIYTQAHIAHETGLPIMRHHLLHFWNDSKAITQDQQYMFGEAFLAAPVVDKGRKDWEVYLPTFGIGKGPYWLDVASTFKYETTDGRFRIGFSGFYEGGQVVKVDAPLDTVPLFIQSGSIIPVLDPRVMTLNNASNTSVITFDKLKYLHHLWIFPDQYFSATGTSWEHSFNLFQSGPQQLKFSSSASETGSVHVLQVTGPWEKQGLPESVTSGGVALKGAGGWEEVVRDGSAGSFFYDKEQQVLWVRLVQGMNATITLN